MSLFDCSSFRTDRDCRDRSLQQHPPDVSNPPDQFRQGLNALPLAFLRIARPENVIITALSVVVAGVISNPHWTTFIIDLIVAALSAGLIAAGGNAFNDVCDRDLDRTQKPHRPIPAGQITVRAAIYWTAGCFVIGLTLALRIGGMAFLIASWAVFLLLLYSWRWKRLPLVGNLSVAFVASLAFIYGGVAVRSIGVAFWAAWLAFFFHLGREIVKDLEDRSGDAAAHADTFVVRYGEGAGRYAAVLAFILLSFSLLLPYYLGGFRIEYLVVALLGVFPVLVLGAVAIWRWTTPEQLHRLNLILKWDMLVGLAALLVGRPAAESLVL